MKNCKIIISREAPSQKDILWAKPITGGFALYLLDGGVWKPIKMMDDKGTQSIIDDTVQDLIGTAQDETTADTINGAKNYADAVGDTIVGTADDTADDVTLYGLRAYIDSQLGGGGGGGDGK